jgi:CBS domain-containing protein
MKVKEIMTSPVEEIGADAKVFQAAKMMKMLNIGVLPVIRREEIVGIVTDRDIAIRVVAERLDPQNTPVGQVMTAEVICCSEDTTIEEAAGLLEENQVHRLLVLSNNKVCGIISIADVVRNINNDRLIREILQSICEPAHA